MSASTGTVATVAETIAGTSWGATGLTGPGPVPVVTGPHLEAETTLETRNLSKKWVLLSRCYSESVPSHKC